MYLNIIFGIKPFRLRGVYFYGGAIKGDDEEALEGVMQNSLITEGCCQSHSLRYVSSIELEHSVSSGGGQLQVGVCGVYCGGECLCLGECL